jgi:hypothetical protein
MSTALLLAASEGLGKGLLLQVGGAAGLITIMALLLVLPLYLTQRREVRRLERWRELEPERGDEGAPQPAAAVQASPVTTPQTRVAARPTGAYLSPAERVTADRPALSRITAERAAIESPSFWRRLIARGPRHPLVLSLLAIVTAGAVVAAVGLLSGTLGGEQEGAGGGGVNRAEVAVVVLNGSGAPALADRVADDVASAGFENVRTGMTGAQNQTVVLFDKGQRKAANAVGRELGVSVLQPLDRETRAIAPSADVVVVAGEDRARA